MVAREYRSPIREKHAEDTRRKIVEAAGDLFAARGYAATSVADVAAAAGVAVNTIYTSIGGKPGLITALVQDGAHDDVAVAAERRIGECADPVQIIRITAEATGQVRRRRGQVLAILLDSRTADPHVAAAAELATRAVRDRLGVIAARLVAVGGLRPGLTRKQVEQILWFYFGFEAWRTARGFGWSWSHATDWLAEQATHALTCP